MKVIVTPQGEKYLIKLPKVERRKVQKKLLTLERNPFSGKRLGGEYEGRLSLKVWPYRIIYWIDKGTKTIYVISILHRQGAYS